jgi:serralysin
LIGSAGRDVMTGAAGPDVYQFMRASDSTRAAFDDITGFSSAEGDRIDLRAIDANTSVAGDQAFAFIGPNTFTGVAGQLRMNSAGSEWYLDGDVDGDRVADFRVRIDVLPVQTDFLF